jgi:uncharacterized membrane protein
MRFPQQLDLRTQQRIAWGCTVLALLVYIAVLSFQSVLRYATFKATAFDLGNMDQVLWNTIHGRPFQFTNQAIDWYGPPNRLAIHVEPIMLLVAQLYTLHSDPRTLLIFQTLVLAAGAPAVFLLTRRYLPSWPLLAAVLAMAYLVSPALLGINIFDFHPDSLATPLLLYALLALAYRRSICFVLLCLFVCACKEDMPLAVAFLGILLIWKYRLPYLGLALLLGGCLWTTLAFKLVIPHFYVGVQPNNFWYRYQFLGSTPIAAVVNLLEHPWLIFTQIITLDRIYYLFSLLRSSGFLAVLAPEWLLPALPKFASNFLSSNSPNYSGVYHYNAAVIPFVMLAALHGARRLALLWQSWSGKPLAPAELELLTGRPAPDISPAPCSLAWVPAQIRSQTGRTWQRLVRWQPVQALYGWLLSRWQRFGQRMYPFARSICASRLQGLLCLWVIFTMGLNYLIAIPQLNSFWADHLPGAREQQIQQVLNMIPPDASVSASDDLNPHLSERENLAVFPTTCLDATCEQTVEYIIVDLNNLTLANRADATAKLNQLSRQYRLLKSAYGVELFIRRSVSQAKHGIIL